MRVSASVFGRRRNSEQPRGRFGRSDRRGMTLIEILISTALVGGVMAISFKGFDEIRGVTERTKSQVTAQHEATQAVKELSRILKRSHVIYYDARPLGDAGFLLNTVGSVNAAANAGLTVMGYRANGSLVNVPEVLRFGAPTGSVFYPSTNGPHNAAFDGTYQAVDRRDFRFLTVATDTVGGFNRFAGTTRFPLRQADQTSLPMGATAALGSDRVFSNPLLYCAEATFNTNTPAGGGQVQLDSGLPVTWTFRLVYLAPMRFNPAEPRDVGDGLLPLREPNAPGDRRDRIQNGVANGIYRSNLPLELRLMTIPDVRAVVNALAPPNFTNSNYFIWGRRADLQSIYPFPMDVRNGRVNYDPVALDMAAQSLNAESTGQRILNAAGTLMAGVTAASGSRVRLSPPHPNFGYIGNDPPSQDALNYRGEWTGVGFGPARAITDVVLARYVDPDSVGGTCVRLANGNRALGIPAVVPGSDRNYVNAYAGPQRWRPGLQLPKKALVSVVTRYRTARRIPFSFGSESIEVELTAMNRYHVVDRLRRN